MLESEITLDWIISNHGSFFLKFNITHSDIRSKFTIWSSDNNSGLISEYLFFLLSQVGLSMAKTAVNEIQGHEWKLEFSEKMLDYCNLFQKPGSKFWKKQIKFENAILEQIRQAQS